MPDRPPDPIEQTIRALLRRERLANTATAETLRNLETYLSRIEELIRRVDPTAVSAKRYRDLRTRKLLKRVDGLVSELPGDLERELRNLLAPIGRAEAVAARMDLVATIGTVVDEGSIVVNVTQARIRSILSTDPIRGLTLPEHLKRVGANLESNVRRGIRTGMIAEESIPDIIRRVDRFAFGKARRQTEAVVRTAVTDVSARGQLGVYRANEKYIESVQYVATLDDRTTIICLDLDGSTWPPGSDEIVVPGADTHYQCRSTLAPNPDYAGLGLPEPAEGTRFARRSPKGDGKVGKVERISSSTTAERWLKDQPKSRVRRMLGKSRADAFLSGEVTLGDMIRKDRTRVPLSELLGGS